MQNIIKRRSFLKYASSTLVAAPFVFPGTTLAAVPKQRAAAPPSLTVNVKDYGAQGDGTTNDTKAIQRAIDRVSVFGGGSVHVPAGDFLIGAIQLRSNVTLDLAEGACLKGTDQLTDYPVMQVRWEGKWIDGHVGLLYAVDAQQVAIQGMGKIEGNSALGGRPSKENPLRRPALVEFINCSQISLSDFHASYHRMWCVHPTNCTDIQIRNLTIRSTGGNGDGIDIDSCKRVNIDSCDIATGDDCIAIKSGRGMEAYTLMNTTEDIQIKGCTFADSIFACIGIGSETSGGIRNVSITNCRFTHAKTYAIYIKSRPGRGAFIENIRASDLLVESTGEGFLRFNLLKSGIQDQNPVPGLEGIPKVSQIHFSNIQVKDVPVLVEGTLIHPRKPLEEVTLAGIKGTCKKGIFLVNTQHITCRDIQVQVAEGALFNTYQVSGTGLDRAKPIEGPLLEDDIPENNTPYKLG